MPRTVRKAGNRALFREVNEQIAGVTGTFEAKGRLYGFVCECNRLGCAETMQIPLGVYARLRDDPSTFVVLPGHEDLEQETIVAYELEYVVVRDDGFHGD